jgi:hypothetical protein
MIVQRDVQKLTVDEMTNYLCDAGLGGYLTRSEFEEIMDELTTRGLHPETLASLMTFGQPEWYKSRLLIRI